MGDTLVDQQHVAEADGQQDHYRPLDQGNSGQIGSIANVDDKAILSPGQIQQDYEVTKNSIS